MAQKLIGGHSCSERRFAYSHVSHRWSQKGHRTYTRISLTVHVVICDTVVRLHGIQVSE